MAKVDKIKERISYLKFWLGIFVVTLISLIGWLVSNYETAKRVLIVLDMLSILVILVMVLVTHRTIQKLIQTLEEL